MCCFGDSFVAGVGDPHHLGWVGRVAARAEARGVPLTAYNLGIRLNTSADVRARWREEAERRCRPGCENRVVLSFGVNDTTDDGGGTRVRADASVENLAAILHDVAVNRWPALMVGPAPIADAAQNARTRNLDRRFADLCAAHEVPYVEVFGRLDADPAWMSEVKAGDGAHPAAAGYDRLAELMFAPWWRWLRR